MSGHVLPEHPIKGRRADLWLLIAIAAATVVAHLLTGGRYGFHRDELATLADARHLAWGYVAYPPVTPFFGWLSLHLFGTSLTDTQLWAMIGVTPMIGVNDVVSEVFTQSAATQLTTWAKQQGIGMLSMWSIGRDHPNQAGVSQGDYDFANIFEGLMS